MSKKSSTFASDLDQTMKRFGWFIMLLLLCTATWAEEKLNGVSLSGYGWKGFDFGTPCVVSIVGWKTSEASTNAQLGIFEGANRADFMDAIPLLIIDQESILNSMNYARVDCSRGFRYVRYVAPSGKENWMPDIEIWGDYSKGDDSHLYQLTNLPTVTIHTKNGQIPYDKVHEIEAYISIISNDGKTILSDTATIRERGNASRNFPKKPYRIKFANKHHVLGAPANARKWTLINNYGDKTLMRNQLAFEISRRVGMPYTPFCAYVDVILNGDYKGCYQLCDQIEVRKNRVQVTEMTPNDNSGEALTGGYLIEADAYANSELSMFWSDYGTGVTIKYPKEDSITSQQKDYIRQQYSKAEKNWKKYLDLNTFLRHFIVGELSGNTDTYWSMYLYKQRANDTLFVGPVWDFDLAFDNDNRTYPIKNLPDYIYRTNGSTTGYLRTLVDQIVVQDAAAKKQLLAIWTQARKAGLTEESFTEYLDEQEQILQQSQRLNFMRWPILNSYVHQNPRVWGSYSREVNNVRTFINQRISWMDKKLGFDPITLDIEQQKEEATEATKIIQNGQVLIIRNGAVYTPFGTRVQ